MEEIPESARRTIRWRRWLAGGVLAAAAIATAIQLWPTESPEMRRPSGATGGSTGGADDGSPAGLVSLAKVLLRESRPREAEKTLREALEADPHCYEAHAEMALLLNLLGRRREAAPHLLVLLQANQHSRKHLGEIGELSVDVEFVKDIDKILARSPDDPRPLLAKARAAFKINELSKARGWLERVIVADANLIEAQAWLGLTLAAQRDEQAFLKWNASLPPAAEDHPDVWVARGNWAEHLELFREAARCYWEAVRRDPNHRQANHLLGQTLAVLDEESRAQPFRERGKLLSLLFTALLDEHARTDPVLPLKQAAELCEALGRPWEAWAWSQAALEVDSRLAWAMEMRDRMKALLDRERPSQTLESANPALTTDLSLFPLPKWAPGNVRQPHRADPPIATVSFRDDAQSAGIFFQHFNSDDPTTDGARLLETLGGGIAAFDFDGDGWCDLYFTQGCAWPPSAGQPPYSDRLFRNLGNGKFADVTIEAGLGDDHYSFGVAAGDIDNDGHIDLYLANVDLNRLYRNNGDGTFREMGVQAGIATETWTSSCAIVDLNGDGLPELFDSTYATGKDIHSFLCQRGGRTGTCAPTTFHALRDRLWVNRGDGTFEEVGKEAGLDVIDGYGLGVLAADFDGSGRMSVFVANDSKPNFLFENVTATIGGDPKFEQNAVLWGLHINDGAAELANMGIAADDANGDGRVDMLITTLFQEPNAYYVQIGPKRFRDRAKPAGIHDPSFKMLGFGTQFVDGELDGHPDLIVVNGHVDDYRWMNFPWKMRPQYFQNKGDGSYREVQTPQLGAYFQGEFLGRPLARLDWNRDGLDDFVATHLDVPAVLGTNVTREFGHGVTIELRGVRGARDAVGAKVEAVHGGRTRTRWMFGGDGYQVTNERRLVIGLGESRQIASLRVTWPGGAVQTWNELPVDVDLLLIEGRADAVISPRSASPAGRAETPAAAP